MTTKVFNPVDGRPGRHAASRPTGSGATSRTASSASASTGSTSTSRTSPIRTTPLAETVDAFEALLAEGTIGAWGLSNYDAAGIEEALAHGRPAVVQNSYSLLDRERRAGGAAALRRARDRLRAVRPARRRLADRASTRAAPASPQGSRMTMRPEPYEHLVDDRVFDGARPARAPRPASAASSMAALAFAWVLAHPHVTAAVCGPSRRSTSSPCSRRSTCRSRPDGARPHRLVLRMTRPRSSTSTTSGACCRWPSASSRWPRRSRRWRATSSTTRCASSSCRPTRRAFMGLMPAYRGGARPALLAEGRRASRPGNPARGLDSHQGFVALFDGETGRAARVRQRRRRSPPSAPPPSRRSRRGCSRARRRARSRSSAPASRRGRTSRRCAPCAASSACASGAGRPRRARGARRRRGGGDRRGGARRRRRRRHRDDVARADRPPRVARRGRARERRRLEHPDRRASSTARRWARPRSTSTGASRP